MDTNVVAFSKYPDGPVVFTLYFPEYGEEDRAESVSADEYQLIAVKDTLLNVFWRDGVIVAVVPMENLKGVFGD